MIFATLDLSRRLERAEAVAAARSVEARSRLHPDVGAQWIEVQGTYAMFDGPISPVTQTFGLGLFAEPSAAELEKLEAFFLERGAPVYHEVSPLAGVAVAHLLSRRGYRPVEFTSILYQPLTDAASQPAPANPSLRTRLMVPGEEELWAQINARGWDQHQEWREFLLDSGRLTGSTEGALAFFACLDEEPIGAGVLRRHEGVALFAGACTVPEARNRGAQRALLATRMKHALSVGCDLAMMGALPGSASQRNAERHGFRIAYTRTKWQLSAG